MDKQILNFTVNEQILVCENPIKISTNKVNYIQNHFDLGENWDGFDSVRAVWFNDFNCISTVLDSLGNCVVPFEVMKRKGNVKVNLVGSISEDDVLTDRLTSYPVVAVIVDCTAQIVGSNTQPITPSEFELFAQRVHTDAERAEQGASDAETSAQNASNSADEAEEWADKAEQASANAGQYSNASRGYSEQAGESATSASGSATSAGASKLDSEAYAVGKRNGTGVGSEDVAYHNNAKYYAEQASGSAASAESAKSAAETAKGAAETAQTAAETAQAGAETAQARATEIVAGCITIDAETSELIIYE